VTLNNGFYLQGLAWITLVVCGLVQYFTGIGSVLWLPFILACVMVILLMMQTRFSQFSLDTQEQLILFGLVALQNGVTVTIVGFKNELALALITLCLLLGFCRESQIYRVTQTLYWICCFACSSCYSSCLNTNMASRRSAARCYTSLLRLQFAYWAKLSLSFLFRLCFWLLRGLLPAI